MTFCISLLSVLWSVYVMINSNSTQFNNEIYTKRMQTMKHDRMYAIFLARFSYKLHILVSFSIQMPIELNIHASPYIYLNLNLNLYIFLCSINQCFRMPIDLVRGNRTECLRSKIQPTNMNGGLCGTNQ